MAAETNAIPQWAKDKAVELCHSETVSIDAFARYIAEHEEGPADPLLIEAREIVVEINQDAFPSFAREVRAGEHDGDAEIEVALAALKRGIEIGRGDAPLAARKGGAE